MSETYNLFDELIGLVEYLEEPEQWSTDEIKDWSDRCLVWIRQQIKLNEVTLKATNQTGRENNQ
jgi:hypothetical protein